MKTVLIILFVVSAGKGFAAIPVAANNGDTTPFVKLITMDRKILKGQLQYATNDSIYVLPGTARDAKKGRFYNQVVVSYKEVISIRKRSTAWIGLMLFGLIGLVGLYLVIVGTVPVFNNGWGWGNLLIYLSPVITGASIWEILKRKRYVINGSKSRYETFRHKYRK